MRNKAAASDFKESNLPSTRLELFFDIIKNNYRTLMLIGFILLCFAIPIFAVTIIKEFVGISFYDQLQEALINEEEYLSLVGLNNVIFNAINIISYVILSVGVAGVLKIIKRLCFLDPVFFFEDFKAGVKDNFKETSILFGIFGILRLLNNLATDNIENVFVGIIPTCITIMIVVPTFIFMLVAISIYKIKFISTLYTSFLLYIKSALKTLLVYVICLLPFLVLLIPNTILKIGVLAVIFMVFLPFMFVGMFDYCCGVFDENINKTEYPEIYRKGLYNKEQSK